MAFYVSRQIHWGVDEDRMFMVEVAGGGSDYSNPGELLGKYPGEQREYSDPREAVKAALKIAELWRADGTDLEVPINVGAGFTGGYTMPFDPMTEAELLEWGEEMYQELPKCDYCDELFEEKDGVSFYDFDGIFCSDYCGEQMIEDWEISDLMAQIEGEPDDAEIYVTEHNTAVVNPTEEEISYRMQHCGTVAELKARFAAYI